MKEIFIYLVVAICSLIVTGYAVHMFVGGLVSVEIEYFIITIVCAIVSGVMGYMVRDVIQHRSGKK